MRVQVVVVTARAAVIAACTVVNDPLPSEATVNIGVNVETSPMPVVTGSQLSGVSASTVVVVTPLLTNVEATLPKLARNLRIVYWLSAVVMSNWGRVAVDATAAPAACSPAVPAGEV